ncbi:MAG TPA: serine/threonine-protein kinase [Gemmataceae bacterium]|nr:serine/threonine-protein kinase [Gemmataceae bacterium]
MNDPAVTNPWPATDPAPAADWPAIPGYAIVGELGRGGMGVVFRATHPATGRDVALKVMRDGALAGPQARARFGIEAEAAARVRHPNVVAIHEVGEHAGQPYLAMEYVGGGSLDQHLAHQPQPARTAAELTRTLADAVAAAHALRIVHRDLKPANVLLSEVRSRESEVSQTRTPSGFAFLTSDSRLLTPLVSDFGLAKRLDTDSTALTHDGVVVGTPSYMAPEQAAGRVQEVGPWSDVYALGAILFEMLTGRPPFEADSWDHALQRVIHDEPAPPRRSQPDVPAELETICLKCLEKDHARRYPTAAELAEDLRRFLAEEPVAAVPLSSTERLGRFARRDGYQIVGEIGRGPRSVVYHARYETLNQSVAVKVFAPGCCTRDEWDARLRRSDVSLSHPHIVPIQRAGWWDDAPFVVTEFVPNGSLAGQRFPVKQALELVVQLAELAGYLHRQGTVHGNLKSGNVLLAADGIPRVTDFRATSGAFFGPFSGEGVGYVAPELLDAGEARPHTDVYGLGLILFELLTGRPTFASDAEQVRSVEPEPPSKWNPDVSPALDAACLKCLRKNPWHRYTRAYDLRRRLQAIADDDNGRGIPRPKKGLL